MSCMNPLKCILVLINLLFWFSGAVLIYAGVVYIQADHGSVAQSSAWPAVILLCAAGVLVLGGVIGCVGTLWEKKACLGLFLVFLATVLIVSAAISGVMLVHRSNLSDTLDDFVLDAFQQYDNTTANSTASDSFNKTSFVDTIQQDLHCCGYNNYTDWTKFSWSHNNRTVPLSCCRPQAGNHTNCTGSVDSKQINLIYQKGCKKPLNDAFHKFYNFLSWSALAIAILILVGSLVVIGLLFRQRNRPLGYSELSPGYTEA